MMTGQTRPAIPNAVKRALRQEAGFGCCVCGLPILQYHHIVEWSDEQHNRLSDMMVLCPTHHDQASKGAFPKVEQRAAKVSPFNIERGRAGGLLAVKQSYPAIDLGSVTVVNEGSIFEIDGEQMLGMEIQDGSLLVSLLLRSQSGEQLCLVDQNEWLSGDPMAWDIEADWQRLTIRERAESINLSLNVKSIPASLTGEFWGNGDRIKVTNDRIILGSRKNFSYILKDLALVGTSLKLHKSGAVLDAGGGGALISWSDRRERLWKAAEKWREIKASKSGPDAS